MELGTTDYDCHLLQAHQPWQPLRATKSWQYAKGKLWQSQLCAWCTQASIACHGCLTATTQSNALYCCNCWLWTAFQKFTESSIDFAVNPASSRLCKKLLDVKAG